MKEEDRVDELIGRWTRYGMNSEKYPSDQLYCRLKNDLYQVRNAGWKKNPPLSAWPTNLIDKDDEIMAAIEHYFLCRCWIGTAKYSTTQMRAMISVYTAGKRVNLTKQHNPNKPVTPPSELQSHFQNKGIRHGESDRDRAGLEAPLFAPPPSY